MIHMDDKLVFAASRPPRADAVKNRELLIETAQRLFAENGVDAVTMSDVAEAAHVGKGTLYRHFANKMDLCHVLIDNDQRDLQNRTFARLREGGDVLEDLEWFLHEVTAFLERNQEIALAASAQLGGMIDHPAHIWWRQTIRGLLLRMNPPFDVDYVADVFFVMLDPRTLHYQTKARGFSYKQAAESLITLLHQLLY
jgi:AcrR family transcriptional regulator